MNHSQIANLIKTTGSNVTYLCEGEPGIGKSSILSMLKQDPDMKDYQFIYIDCPTMDLPDVQLPYVENGVSKFATNALWGVESDKPKVIMLDELSKSSNVTRLLFTRLLLEHQIGNYELPEGSIVFATGNQTKDGVGDSFPAHMMNRVTSVTMRKPSAEEWIDWAQNNNIDPIVMAWVKQFPHCLDEGSDNNPYIFNPKTNNRTFVSPRSLAKASTIVEKRSFMDAESLNTALKGTIGASAAADMAAYIVLANQLPTWDSVLTNPDTTKVPDSVPAQLIMAYGGLSQFNMNPVASTADKLAEYFTRFPTEVTAVALSSMAKNPATMKSKVVVDWVKANTQYLI